MACSKADALVGNKRFFTCGTLETCEKHLFPTKASALLQAIKVCQLGQDVCSAGNTFER